ncbi:Phosphatidylinositol 3-kinase regulatory subunit alpha [Chelonia mydas]|uniref:Phosphatidylinositol 3-kinase regulatory subunit alpha n=1 Tax=Chelonia mydas TaxID=8469 RepID=M7ATA5_CHEMY|nr:Phosphatidylinositol 3-kinase regulatory subunit alpha [Chelonia mydas]
MKETQSLEECGQRVKMVLESPTFPQQHGLLLQHLTSHFCKLGQNSSKSHLTPRALGELFGEVLFRPSASCTEVNSEHHAKIIEALIVAGGVAEMQAAPGRKLSGNAGRDQFVHRNPSAPCLSPRCVDPGMASRAPGRSGTRNDCVAITGLWGPREADLSGDTCTNGSPHGDFWRPRFVAQPRL